MAPVILMRAGLAEEEELQAARKHFPVFTQRAHVPPNSLVIGRYSVLPYYDELHYDLYENCSELINEPRAHRYIADMQNWFLDFEDLTPMTWFRLEDVPGAPFFQPDHPGFVLKGATNSRKQLWDTHMFAKNRGEVMKVALRLMDDTLVGAQGIYVRAYEPLEQLGEPGPHGLPFTNEHRWFFLDGEPLARGFYWSERVDEVGPEVLASSPPPELIAEVGRRLKAAGIRFVVVDFGRKPDGTWVVIELNDGQMSGLSCIDPELLYSGLVRALRTERLPAPDALADRGR